MLIGVLQINILYRIRKTFFGNIRKSINILPNRDAQQLHVLINK
jgi:hypothetical protein